MALSDHVSLTITQDSVGIARAGFGVPLILSATADFAARSQVYTDLAGVLVDFPDGTPEARAATAMFSQSPHPERIRIGRSALPPTQVYTLSVGVVRNSYAYSIEVALDDGTEATATFTSDADATDGEIVVGLVAALNAVAGNNYIAAGTTSPFTVTADAAGDWFALEVNPADVTSAMTHADPGVATDLAAIALESSDWYALCTLYNSDAYAKAAAAWVEANKRLYLADLPETIAVNVASDGTQGTLDDLKALAYERTAGLYHPRPAEMFAAAMLGKVLPLDPGSETWAYKRLSGVSPATLTATHRTNLDARNAGYFKTEAGVNITWQGKVASGNFVDITRSLDWLDDDMRTGVFGVVAAGDVFGALVGAAKIPYTDAGVALIVAQVRASLRRATKRGILSPDPEFTVTFPLVADVATIDKAARLLPDIKFSATLAGAVHRVVITGVVSV